MWKIDMPSTVKCPLNHELIHKNTPLISLLDCIKRNFFLIFEDHKQTNEDGG